MEAARPLMGWAGTGAASLSIGQSKSQGQIKATCKIKGNRHHILMGGVAQTYSNGGPDGYHLWRPPSIVVFP